VRRVRVRFAGVVATSLLAACGGGGAPGPSPTEADFASFVHDVIARPADSEPASLDGVTFTDLDAPEGSFDDLLPPP
jgi:hypothetical protein